MSKISRRAKELKSIGDHAKFLKRIRKTLYYGILPASDVLSLPVTELASELFSEPRMGLSLDRLYCKDAAHISREVCISPCSFVLAMLYLERLKACNPEYLQCVVPSQLFLVSLMVSSKFLFDSGEDSEVIMSYWAVSGGIALQELINLERDFLNAIQWDIFVNELTFWQKLSALESTLAKREGNSRGYFTYTEVNTLLQSFDLHVLINAVTTIMAVLVTTYMAGILTIVGSLFIASQIPGHCLNLQLSAATNITSIGAIDNDTVMIRDNLYMTRSDYKKSSFPQYGVHALQTSILLTSIQSSLKQSQETSFPAFSDDVSYNSKKEEVSWDWWNSPSLTWLSHASRLIETLKLFAVAKFTYDHFVDMSIANSKILNLQDHLHKSTTIRLQDQLERSWHTEWKDTITDFLTADDITHFFREVKA